MINLNELKAEIVGSWTFEEITKDFKIYLFSEDADHMIVVIQQENEIFAREISVLYEENKISCVTESILPDDVCDQCSVMQWDFPVNPFISNKQVEGRLFIFDSSGLIDAGIVKIRSNF